MITMRGISIAIASEVKTSSDFTGFEFFVNVDLSKTEVSLPYFAVATFTDSDDRQVRKSFKTQILMGIASLPPITTAGITEDPSLDILETLGRKAVELIETMLRDFGVQGDKNIHIAYLGMYIPEPAGEDDLQIQIDIEFEQEKFLTC